MTFLVGIIAFVLLMQWLKTSRRDAALAAQAEWEAELRARYPAYYEEWDRRHPQ